MSQQVVGQGSVWGGWGGGSLSATDLGPGAGCNCRSWCEEGPRGRGFRQNNQLEQATQGGLGAHLGALVTAQMRGPAVRCRGTASWKGRASYSP